MAARKRKPPRKCSVRKCHETITPEIGDKIFQEYWEQGSHSKRRAYVAARIERLQVARKRSRKDDENRQKYQTFKYFLEINGRRIQVCRDTLKNTLGETDRFIRGVPENKKNSTSGITTDDQRGKKIPPHALSKTEKAAAVQRHIRSFPAYVSHYCRAKTGEQKYLSSDLTVAEMYRLYQADETNPTVSLSTYTAQFKLSGLKIHPPQTDGCDTCDTLEISIKGAASLDEKKSLEAEKERHLRRAEKAYDLKKQAKAAAKKDPTSMVIVADLQQCLPTPHLKCKRIYYSRQLYVLNYTVFDCSTGLTHCYMWSEVEGNRGSNEIATCLLKHILEVVPDGVKKLTLFSDCCPGQNRNSPMSMMMFVALQQHPTLQEIHHIFLVSGHTFMPEVDGKHAGIENYKTRLEKINVPEEWYAAVEQAGKTDPKNFPDGKFKVTHVKSFLDIASLAKDELIRRKTCTDKEPLIYMETHWWKYSKSSLGMVQVKSSFCEDAEFRVVSFLRKGIRGDRLKTLLPCLKTLPASRPISDKKKKDLLGLLGYLDEEFHAFYLNLPVSNSAQDFHPLSHDTDEEENDLAN
ncbi:Secretory carrier-associated membrane protein 3 [Frankliniella fusca]|uniref:Secretory carrier-associated membrane protein 3 n=1 Tax=Frankliniella fusca TaxID=407009 RepID=A0AAE1GZK2_9NEOP|nr:Secretory carrier-associated membrane protein 3 [Frankliniella fusca]